MAALVLGGVLLVVVVLGTLSALAARARLETARQALEEAQDRIVAGEFEASTGALERAEEAFAEARGFARSPILRVAGWIPLAGRSVDAVVVLSESGQRIATAGIELAEAIEGLDGGIGALAPRDGRLPVEAIAALSPATTSARHELEAALQGVEALPTSWLAGPVADARDQALAELHRAVEAARSAEALSAALPSLAGSQGERRYFVAAQTTAELRGTGGFMGAYSILTASDGRLLLEPMKSIISLPDVPEEDAPEPPPGFAPPFDRFGGTGFWRNLNMVPHAPTAARLIERLYEQVTGDRLDGVIFVDPQALADMLEATGPVDAPTLGRTLDSGGVVDYLTNEAYLEFGSAAERKRVLGVAVLSVLTRFLSGTDPIAAFRSLAEATDGGHLVLHSADPEIQAALETAGVAGVVGAAEGDYFALFTSNADGTKVDYYTERSITYEVELDDDGGSNSVATIAAHNAAPEDADPSYVLGPYPGTGLGPGESRSFLATYCAPGCRLEGATMDGEPAGLETHHDRGFPLFTTFVLTDPGQTATLALDLGRDEAWIGGELGGTYRLTLRVQQTVRPTSGTVSIRIPDGMRLVDSNVPMDVTDGVASWQGVLSREQEFLIRFQKPFPGRAWTQAWDVLSTPLF